MIEVRLRSRSRSMRGQDVMSTYDGIANDPEMQATIKRLGENVSSINSASIDRVQYVLGVASVVRAARLR